MRRTILVAVLVTVLLIAFAGSALADGPHGYNMGYGGYGYGGNGYGGYGYGGYGYGYGSHGGYQMHPYSQTYRCCCCYVYYPCPYQNSYGYGGYGSYGGYGMDGNYTSYGGGYGW